MEPQDEKLGQGRVALGIDPGKEGFTAGIGSAGYDTWPTPTVNTGPKGRPEYDVPGMVAILRPFAKLMGEGVGVLATIEKQQSMPGQGVVSTFSIGYGFGLWCGILAALGIPYQVVHPRTWRRALTADLGGDEKSKSIIAAQRLFPGVNLLRTERCRTPDHNKADAMLLMEYGRRSVR